MKPALYPMRLSYVPKSRIWGGRKLKTVFGKEADFDTLGETWELTVRADGMSRVLNGVYAGRPLGDLFREFPAMVAPGYDGEHFPLLIKLIDAADRLSVQVHPDNDYAARVEHDVGKTEMWYILSAEEGAEIVYGLLPGVDRAGYAAAVNAGDMESPLFRRKVRAGDVCFIPSGLVHAIGAGITVAEIQQNSDLTYRVYDYDRRDAQGNARELHVARALDVVRPFTEDEITTIRYARSAPENGDVLADCPYFRVEKIRVAGDAERTADPRSFTALLAIAGDGRITAGGETYPIRAGESWLIPAGMGAYRLEGDLTLLASSV